MDILKYRPNYSYIVDLYHRLSILSMSIVVCLYISFVCCIISFYVLSFVPRKCINSTHTHKQREMENTTSCASTDSHEEYHPLLLVGMVVLSAISTLAAITAKRLQKRIRARGINTAAESEYG